MRSRLKIILPAITVLMVCCIWGHSMMPGDTSASESGWVYTILNSILGEGVITEHIVRKTAHFTEYAILGVLCCADLRVYGKNSVKYLLLPLFICLFTAVTDETIQLFVPDRSGMLSDVWIDYAGSVTGIAIFTCLNAGRRVKLQCNTDNE